MENCWKIGTGKLHVYVAKPGTLYARTRFDWTGFIPQVEMDGKTFCIPEATPGTDEGTGGIGICNEFRPTDMGIDPADRYFLKPGIGLIDRQEDETYAYDGTYPVVQPFPTTVQVRDNAIDFHLEPIALRGMAYSVDKHVAVIDNMLIITTTMKNVGEKPLTMREYNHNFLSLNGAGSAPGVHLSVHPGFWFERGGESVVQYPDGITFDHDFEGDFMMYDSQCITDSPKRWELRDNNTGMRVEEWGDFPISRYLGWGRRHVTSAEIYTVFDLPVGESHTWTRMWKFYT